MNKYIDVVIFKNVISMDKLFTYENNLNGNIGDYVIVDFNNSLEVALIIKTYENDSSIKSKKTIKLIKELKSLPLSHIRLGLWMREFYILTYAKAFSTICDFTNIKGIYSLYKENALLNENEKSIVNKANEDLKLDSNEKRLLNKLLDTGTITKEVHYDITDLPPIKYFSFNSNYLDSIKDIRKNATNQLKLIEEVFDNFYKDEIFSEEDLYNLKSYKKSIFDHLLDKKIFREINNENVTLKTETIPLNVDQNDLVDNILNSTKNKFLIHGVTGSGKTEVYFSLIESTLNENKTAILLVPEIGLTPQMESRTIKRFGNLVSIIHSKLSRNKRIRELNKLESGESKILLGTRSAIFNTIDNLGLIIIDEEHDNSYRLDTNNKYDVREVSRFLTETNKDIKLVLGSATPSIESYFKAKHGVFELFELKNRAKDSKLPEIIITDMKEEISKGNNTPFSFDLLASMKDSLVKNNQTLLFLNRRGYSNSLICSTCGETVKCSRCDISMVYHKSSNMLKCHYCGETRSVNTNCKSCYSRKFKRLGLGTEKLEEFTKEAFKDFEILRIDSDTTSSKSDYEENIKSIESKETSIIIGTQMITKGLDFPNIDTVGVISADLAFSIPEYDASEKAFQVLMQVAGRSGRSEKNGKVIIQTFNSNHYIFKYLVNHDYQGFYLEELRIRKLFNYPPFKRQYTINFLNKDLQSAVNLAKLFLNYFQNEIEKENLGSTTEVLSNSNNFYITRINNRYHVRVYINSSIRDENKVKGILYNILIKNEKKLDLIGSHIDLVTR